MAVKRIIVRNLSKQFFCVIFPKKLLVFNKNGGIFSVYFLEFKNSQKKLTKKKNEYNTFHNEIAYKPLKWR